MQTDTTYINIYSHTDEEGMLYVGRITASTLKIEGGKMNVTDFQVLGDTLFILERTHGIYAYDVAAQTVVHFNIAENYNLTSLYGFSVIFNNAQYQFEVANSTFIISFTTPSL